MNYLGEIRKVLIEDNVSLFGWSRQTEAQDRVLEVKSQALEAFLYALCTVEEKGGSMEQITDYVRNYRYAVERVTKVMNKARALKNTNFDVGVVCDEVLVDFQDLVGWTTGFKQSVLTNYKFKQAAKLSTYYSVDEIAEMLTDESILKALREKGLDFTLEEVAEVFSKSTRIYFARGNDPIKGILRVGEHFKVTLTDESILKALREKGLDFKLEEVAEVFSQSTRLHFAGGKDPLKGIQRVGEHFKVTLTDENILKALKEEGLDFTLEEVVEVFSRAVRLRLAVHYISDPLKGVLRVGEHLKVTLTDENILKALKENGLDFTLKEVAEAFPRYIRLHFAVQNISDPLNGCVRYILGEFSVNDRYFKTKRN